ncbi:MAG TPA: LLM class F420-dependent oxidoreductase [Mycobacteriales bacterium]|nr:LLM class F420-dependent oxidoreductase [Mycobacteriales bacterium]
MTRIKIGVQLQPQHTTVADLRAGWRAADALGVDSIWTWDHFFPLYGEADGSHFEGWTLLAAMAADTRHAQIGLMVSCNSYRNPELVADMARTIDHISGGRTVLGIGAGWFERDYDEYGYDFGTAPERLRALGEALPRIRARLSKLHPGPIQLPLPLCIGGGGERVTLRLVAEYAHMWNGFGPPERFALKSRVLDEWCDKLGRDPAEIERTALVSVEALDRTEEWTAAGATHLIAMTPHPFDLAPVEKALANSR